MKRTALMAFFAVLTGFGVCLPAGSAQAAFGLHELEMSLSDSGGVAQTQAGSHPFEMTTKIVVNADGVLPSEGGVREIVTDLPPGLVANPNAVPKCSAADFANTDGQGLPACPDETAVGVIETRQVSSPVGTDFGAVYNLTPSHGSAALLGFHILKVSVLLEGGVRANGDRNVFASIYGVPQAEALYGSTLSLWGNPADPAHDGERGRCYLEGSCPVDIPEKAFLTLPTSCGGPLETAFHAVSWLSSAAAFDGVAESPAVTGCEGLGFGPTASARPATVAEAPSGLDFDLDVDDPGLVEPGGEAESAIRKAVVTLPEGLTTNSSVASGLGACSLAQYESEATDTPPGAGCPESSKVGSLEVLTPLLDEPLGGSIFVAKQKDNPFGNLLTIYMVIRNRERGIMIKQAGRVDPDPVTGQLTTTFDGLPQLPFSHFRFHFREGPRAPLVTPPTCGNFTTNARLFPWSGGPPVDSTSTFSISSGAGGAPCVTDSTQLPNDPAFQAGTLSSLAGGFSPFVLRLSRGDGSQRLSSLTTTLPEGLLGKLAGVPYCPEGGIAQALSRSDAGEGELEITSPSCPATSEVGTVSVGAGAGPMPYFVSGRAYLAGPYKGAPLSLEIITPAIAGPFDLGVVAIRTALRVDPESAQITAVSDPIPSILHGLPLNVRSIDLSMSRPGFTLNPTSCEPKSVLAAVTSTLGQTASLGRHFQVTACGSLRFSPKLSLKLKGGTRRNTFPALTATLTFPKGGASANIARASVALPHSIFLEQGHIGTVCTNPQFAADACPARSVYGEAEAFSPLLDKPLKGPVYLRTPGHELPDLVADLRGQIEVALRGRIDSDSAGGIRTTFEGVPDAPVSKFILRMKGGKKSLLVNSENICAKPQRAKARFTGQNGKVASFRPPIGNECRQSHKRKGKS